MPDLTITTLDDTSAQFMADSIPVWASAVPAWRRSMDEGRSTLLVALLDGAPVGVAQLVHGVIPEVCNVGVLAPHRGHGIGSALMREAERRAAPAGRLRLGVGVDNPSARALYERLGFRPTGERTTTTYDYVGAEGATRTATETDEWMEKALP